MLKSSFVLCISFFCCLFSHGQQVLKGRVLASDTRKPIPVANVFLSNTSVGTITGEDGSFTIQRFPDGRYDLVVSCIGYETFILAVKSDKIPDFLQVVLTPRVTELSEVIVEPYEKDGWQKYGSFFIENFIGASSNAANCKLLNKEVVKFRHSKKRNTLTAFADEPLVLENNALGYVLKYTLTKFEYRYDDRIMYFQGYPLFVEMETKRSRMRARWIKNRQETYKGSLMHFMRSLFRNKLLENNFEVRRLTKIPETEKSRVKAIYQSIMKMSASAPGTVLSVHNMGFSEDSMSYYRKVTQHPDELNVLIDKLLPGDSIAYAIDSVTVGLDFSNHLLVVYPPKKNPIEFARAYLTNGFENVPVKSELFLTTGHRVSVLANGTYYDGIDLLTAGYWAWWEKLGNMLPYEYWPPK